MHKNHGLLERIGCAAVLLAAITMLTGCPAEENVEPPPSTARVTLRYETVPYIRNTSRAAVDMDNLIYSAYDDTQNYYVFLLGHINRVPLAYRPAMEYDGTTSITIGYSSSNVTESSVMESVQRANEYSFSTSMSHNWGVTAGMSFGGDAAPIKASFDVSVGGEYGSGESTSRSTTDTYEVVRTAANEVTDSLSVTIGDNGEPEGLYRFSLFGTTDVYGVVITDRNKSIKKRYLAYCARPPAGWGIDYEPDLVKGSFGKTIPSELLELPDVVPSDLPTPTENVEPEKIPVEKAAIPEANPEPATEGHETKVTVSLSSGNNNNVNIYYTTDGTNPTANSTRYATPITLTTTTTLRAIAIATDGKEPSDIMSRTYTITEQPLQTYWHIDSTSADKSRNIRITDDDAWHTEYWTVLGADNYTNFDINRLRAAGYTTFEFNFSFDAQPIDDGYIDAKVRQGHSGGGTAWKEHWNSDPSGKSWGRVWVQVFTVPLSDFSQGQFTLQWDAHGSSSDDYWLGYTEVKITAKK
ncbi:MAG: chitobiase/beta-hexosaminidase C-terminal domain-containing protein [Treponema sp.]|jgi:hypothetical protein|nr:chitobiase/beta-hexosaminidase C-terminal domain-containing protein [Treponema sp.]